MLGSYFLGEKLGTLGRLGCATCFIGSVVIILHAPPDKDVQTIDEILDYAIQPGLSHWLLYSAYSDQNQASSSIAWPSRPLQSL